MCVGDLVEVAVRTDRTDLGLCCRFFCCCEIVFLVCLGDVDATVVDGRLSCPFELKYDRIDERKCLKLPDGSPS